MNIVPNLYYFEITIQVIYFKLYTLNFDPLVIVYRYSDPQLHVGKKYLYL